MGLFLLVFLTVALGIAAGYQMLEGVLFPHATRVSRRISEEFGKENKAPNSHLFKNAGELSLEAGPAYLNPQVVVAPQPPRKPACKCCWTKRTFL
jgi:hypothetical protein